MKKKELQERLNAQAKQIREMGDRFNANEKRWKDAEEKAAWEKVNKDYDETRSQLDTILEEERVTGRLEDVRRGQSESRNRRRGLPGREDYRGRREDDEDEDEEREDEDVEDEEREEDDEEDEGREDEDDEEDRHRRRGRRDQRGRHPSEAQRAFALQGFFRSQLGMGLETRHVRAMRACRMFPGQRELVFRTAPTELIRRWQGMVRSQRADSINDLVWSRRNSSAYERRAMSTYQMSGGGAWVPSSFVRSLEINMLAYGGMRQVAETIITPGGEDMSWPTADDTSNEGVQIGENQSVGSNTQPSAARVVWRAYKFSSNPVLVDYALLQDSAFDLAAMIGQMLGERIGRITNRKYTYGGGNSTPNGMMTASQQGTTAAASGGISYDDVIKLEHSIDPAYRMNGSYMLHDSILLAVRLLKDEHGQYLWMNGVDVGKPDTLNRRPLTINQHMDATTTAGKKPMVFGDLGRYKIRRVGEIRLYRLEERYRDQDQDGFIAIVREDGNLLNAGTCPVKYLEMT